MRRLDSFTTDHSLADGYVVGANWMSWCADRSLCGALVWGRPSGAEVEALLAGSERLLFDERWPMADRFDVITDAVKMEGAAPDAFTALADYTGRRLSTLTARIRRHAIVAPAGIVGAAVAGLYTFLGDGPEWKLLPSVADACDWIASPAAEKVRGELVELTAGLTSQSPLLRALAAYLGENLADATLEQAAKVLAVSTRSLQRQLADSETTFRGELERARMTEAQRRLAETDEKLETIAEALGFSSPTHFGTRFLALIGERPSEYRNRCRAADPSLVRQS